jgi:Arylsulfotransferase (ASST)
MTARRRIAAMGSLVGVCAICTSTARAALHVIPFPGTPDASPSTGVIFSALQPSDLRSVRVIGARSGRHSGRLATLPARAGTEFVPARPFAPGETVRVTANLRSSRDGTAEGVPGATRLSYSFMVSPRVSLGARLNEGGGWLSALGVGPSQDFHSAPNLHPPVITVTSNPDRGSGDIFVAPVNSPQVGPMILDSQGRLVWFRPVSAIEATNFAVQQFEGQPALTWFQGKTPISGVDVIMNRAYRTVAVVHAGNGYQAELHEFQITPEGTALITCFAPAYSNLITVGGPLKGGVIDGVIQEIDIKTGKVLWEWHALGHIPVDASYTKYGKNQFYDYFHLNSIQQLPNGNLLISARNTWAVYEISRKTGRVLWTLGGKSSSFKMSPGTNFEWQHDARLNGQTLSLLDDAADPQVESQSSAKYLNVDTAAKTVSLLRRFTHTPPVLASASGGVQPLPNGNAFVGWGAQPQVSEYTPSGRQLFNLSFAQGVWTYRAFRFPWVGVPRTRPSLAVARGAGGQVKVYASWNGATQVATWRVLGGSSPGQLKPLGVTAKRAGFETSIEVSGAPSYLAVEALDAQGKVLGISAPGRG